MGADRLGVLGSDIDAGAAMSNENLIFAPFTPEQVSALNRWQASSYVHPFTCPDNHQGDRNLVAREDGWHCPTCSYQQSWAHRGMLHEPGQTSS